MYEDRRDNVETHHSSLMWCVGDDDVGERNCRTPRTLLVLSRCDLLFGAVTCAVMVLSLAARGISSDANEKSDW